MNIKKVLCLFLALIMIFGCTACRKNTDSSSSGKVAEQITAKRKVSDILYCNTDSFNPYTAKTKLNRQLCKLLYEPLVKLDNSFTPVYRLAQSVTNDGKRCTAVLKNAVFSDGSTITASDVVYSFNLAKSSQTVYASQMYEVSSVSAAGTDTVVFNLTRFDPYFINLLDFPILKTSSDKKQTVDGVILPPVGSGRYKLNDDATALLLNDKFFGKKGNITTINLIDAPDEDSVSHYVEIGAASFYYADLSDGDIIRMSGKRCDVNLNNLVYIGINSKAAALSDKYLRYAISSALDRSEICQGAYYNNAVEASGFFSPMFSDVSSFQTIAKKDNLEITVENLGKIGYNRTDSEGYRINSAGKRLSFSLLVNSENRSRVLAARLIATQLKAAGIKITVIERKYSDYMAALSSGNFQLYLGEIAVLNNMDLTQLVVPGGSAAYGIADKTKEPETETEKTAETADKEEAKAEEKDEEVLTISDIIYGFYSGKNSIGDVAGMLITEMPQIPICFRKGLLFYSSDITGGVSASQSDIYFSIEDYTLK